MDIFTKRQRSRIMSRIKSESSIEKLPKSLKRLYLRKHPKGICGNPDFGNKARKIVVFIDGCFWHKCPRHYKKPKSNTLFWTKKIMRNSQRDREVSEDLWKQGWIVIRIWECEL